MMRTPRRSPRRGASLLPSLTLFSSLLVAGIAPPAFAGDRVMIVYDASGSMWGQVEGRAKVEIAREVLGDLLADWDPAQEIGLTAYGHRRKGDCDDIEVLIEPAAGAGAAVAEAVGGISPKGKTPLSEAVRQAAASLRHTEQAATVILISDGEETCDADPCAVGAELAMGGVDFTAHVIGFAVPEEERAGLECLADRTGGLFLPADDAAQLADALEETVAEAAVVVEEEPIPDPGEATLDGPASVPAGSDFEVGWTGPDAKRDFVTLVDPGDEDRHHGNYAYTKEGSPVELRAPDVAGTWELRYVFNPGSVERQVLARQTIEVTAVEATLEAAETAMAGSKIPITWTGPDGRNDFLTIVRPDTPEGQHLNFQYTKKGSPVEILVPIEPGEWEIRYVTNQDRLTLARRPLTVEAAAATLSAPAEVDAGSDFPVEWTGPDNGNDFVTIVPADTPEGKHVNYQYTRKGSPLELRAPDDAGEHEIRYIAGQGRGTVARVPIEVLPVGATLSLPERAPAGSSVEVQWEGPGNNNDFITVVAPETAEGKHDNYTYTRKGNPMQLMMPEAVGVHEVRYVTGQSRRTLARARIELFQIPATLDAPTTATAGAEVEVSWTGPDNKNDFVTLVPVGTPEGKHKTYDYTRKGSPLSIDVPEETGEYELRYLTGQDRKTLARRSIRVE